MVESFSIVLLIEGDDGDSCLDSSHLGNKTLCRVSLIAVEEEFVSWRETGLKQTKSKS